jgi:hypothetical protein
MSQESKGTQGNQGLFGSSKKKRIHECPDCLRRSFGDSCDYCKPKNEKSELGGSEMYLSKKCPGCNFGNLELRDGLCSGCRMLLKQRGLEVYRNTVSDVRVASRAENDLTISVKFSADVEARIRALQRENVGAGSQGKKSGLVDPFYVLSVMLESRKIQSNSVKIRLDYTLGRRFGRIVSGGRYDFMEGVDKGYLVHVSADFDDGCLLPIVAKTLREHLKFGCHASSLSVDGFLKDDVPSQEGQTLLLDKMAAIIPAKIKDEIAPIRS